MPELIKSIVLLKRPEDQIWIADIAVDKDTMACTLLEMVYWRIRSATGLRLLVRVRGMERDARLSGPRELPPNNRSKQTSVKDRLRLGRAGQRNRTRQVGTGSWPRVELLTCASVK